MSGIGTGTALAIGLGASAAGGIASAAIGSSAAGNAAAAQTNAAQQALALQRQNQTSALNYLNQQLPLAQQQQAPYYQAGTQGLQTLSQLLAPGGGLYNQWQGQFTAPTAEQAAQTPGYQFALQQGLQAIQNSAAARGTVMNPGTEKSLAQYAQGLASNTYQQTYNNALTQYQQAYNQFQQGQANLYGRLSGLAGTGQAAANALQQGGLAASQIAGNIYTQGSQQAANILGYQGNAQAAGAINQGNAWGNALGGLGQAGMLYGLMAGQQSQPQPISNPSLMNPGGSYGSATAPTGIPGVAGIAPGYYPTAPTSVGANLFNSTGYGYPGP